MQYLSHDLSADTPVYPGDPPVELRPHATHENDGYRVTDIRLGSHAGTPAHTEPGGATLAALEPERFAFDARLVDCRHRGAGERIRVKDLPAADCDLLVIRTGWDAHWGSERYRDHPVLAPAAAARCADRGHDVGLDTAGPDPHGSTELPAHRALLGAGRLLVENLTGLGGLPRRFRLLAHPLALAGAEASPVRAVADI